MKLPAGKVLIPGVIESKSNFIEHPELIAQRIGRYAQLVGRENVIAGSDCGYGTWVGQAAVDPDVVWAKLAAHGGRRADRVAAVLALNASSLGNDGASCASVASPRLDAVAHGAEARIGVLPGVRARDPDDLHDSRRRRSAATARPSAARCPRRPWRRR